MSTEDKKRYQELKAARLYWTVQLHTATTQRDRDFVTRKIGEIEDKIRAVCSVN